MKKAESERQQVMYWLQTFTGKKIDLINPTREMVDIEDIAHSLSMICRYNGHCRDFYCPTLDQRVLTADLTWVPSGEVRKGDVLIGFDEFPFEPGSTGRRRRRFRKTVVQEAVMVRRKAIRLEMSNGVVVDAAEEHPWLIATKMSRNQVWASSLEIQRALKEGRRRYMHHFIEPWETSSSYEDCWFAGILDGEGTFAIHSRKGCQLSISQNPGLVLNRIRMSMERHNIGYSQYVNHGTVILQIRGGWRENFRVLGLFQPSRLVENFKKSLEGGEFCKQMDGQGEPLRIVKSYDLGMRECAGIQTSTHTYVCEGFGAHNSVAEHSVMVEAMGSQILLRREAERNSGKLSTPPRPTSEIVQQSLALLLHDAAEAYIGDLTTPLKRGLESVGGDVVYPPPDAKSSKIEELERRWLLAIGEAFGLGARLADPSDVMRQADEKVMSVEVPMLFHPVQSCWWDVRSRPRSGEMVIQCWTPAEARRQFISRFRVLYENLYSKTGWSEIGPVGEDSGLTTSP